MNEDKKKAKKYITASIFYGMMGIAGYISFWITKDLFFGISTVCFIIFFVYFDLLARTYYSE